MSEFSRRGFIQTTSAVGAAAIASGVVASAPAMATSGRRPAGPLPTTLVVHVRDVKKAEVALMVGTDEIVYRDEELVARLLDAIARHQER